MAGFLGKLWSRFKYQRSTIPQTFSLGKRKPFGPKQEEREPGERLTSELSANLQWLQATFVYPTNVDLIVRDFDLGGGACKAALLYLDGMTDRNSINYAILQPLMYLADNEGGVDNQDHIAEKVKRRLLPGHQTKTIKYRAEAVKEILGGSSLLLLHGSGEAISIETKGWEHRTIGVTRTEHVVRGPQEGLVETLRANTAAIRRHLRCPSLVTELFSAGRRSNSDVAVMYLYDVADPKLVEEVKRRVKAVSDKTDMVNDSGILEQLIEDHPHALLPQTIATERPDRCAFYLNEGRIVLLVGTSPYALVAPATFSMFLHTAEDFYLRWPYSSFIRLVRFLAAFIALLLPSIYVAVVNYHQEMIPTDLLLAIAAAREKVPFPAAVEVLIMEASFELIREAGVRIPTVIGPTVGIVGALILGQAAVSASIVSPILVIIVALTALSSFAIPSYSAQFTLRILRFVFIALAAVLGFYGIAFGIMMLSIHMVSLKSFGVPFMSPISPYRAGATSDRVNRPALYAETYRPWFLRPLDRIRQKKLIRSWSPESTRQVQNKKNGDGQG